MMSEDKYYVPEPEEFHQGLDFEVNMKDTSLMIVDFGGAGIVEETEPVPVWTKGVFQWGHLDPTRSPFNFLVVLQDKRIRVKHLDGDDIMSLGFEIANDEGNTYRSIKKQRGLSAGDDRQLFVQHELFTDSNKKVRINTWAWWRTNRGDEITVFEGSIKNKSEFKRLLKQIHAESITTEQ